LYHVALYLSDISVEYRVYLLLFVWLDWCLFGLFGLLIC